MKPKFLLAAMLLFALGGSRSLAADPASQFPWKVTNLQFSVPSGISYDPKSPIEITITVAPIGKAARGSSPTTLPASEVVPAGQVRWRITRTRAMPYAKDPHDIWSSDITDVEEIAGGTLPSPNFNEGTEQDLKVSFTPGKYGQFSVLLHGSEDAMWYRAAGAAVVYPPAEGTKPLSPFIANGNFSLTSRGDFRWLDLAGRYGFKWFRGGISATAIPGQATSWDWTKSDRAAQAIRKNNMLMLGEMAYFPGMQPARIGRALITYSGGHKANLSVPLDQLDTYSAYVGQFMQRYGDVVPALFVRNEPWELGSISDYHGSGEYFREVQKALYTAAHAVKPDCTILANDQITNFEDTFLPVPGMKKFVDATSHHAGFSDDRGAVESAAMGKPAWETEDWSSVNDAYVVANMTMKMADGYLKTDPCSEAGYLSSPGLPGGRGYDADNPISFPATTGQAISTWLHFVEDTKFVRELHPDYLPRVLLFSARDQKDSKNVAVLFGHIKAFGYLYKAGEGDVGWPQIDAVGSLALADANQTLEVYDISGNALERTAGGGYEIPLTNDPYYIVSDQNAEDSAAKLESAVATYQGNQLRASLLDFTRPIDRVMTVTAHITNGGQCTVDAHATLIAPRGWHISNSDEKLDHLKPGATRELVFAADQAVASPGNSYPFTLKVTSASGALVIKEDLHAAVFRRGTVNVDGNFDDWQKAGAIPVYLTGGVVGADAVEQYWFPFLKLKASDQTGTFCRFAGLWDDKYFYVMAEVKDATEDYRPSMQDGVTYLMHGAPFDYLYWWGPKPMGTVGDGLKIAFDLFRPGAKNDPWLPPEFQRKIDRRTGGLSADYEYDLYMGAQNRLKESYEVVKDRHLDLLAHPPTAAYKTDHAPFEEPSFENIGPPLPEIWRLMAPGIERGNFYPFSPHLENPSPQNPGQGLVDSGKLVIRRIGSIWRYEAAIPWTELAEVKPEVGKTVRFSFYVQNAGKRALSWTANRSACMGGREILHPTWVTGEAIETPWGFAGPVN